MAQRWEGIRAGAEVAVAVAVAVAGSPGAGRLTDGCCCSGAVQEAGVQGPAPPLLGPGSWRGCRAGERELS